MTPQKTRYFWDFFGPRAEPTARHFERHLGAFLAEHGCDDAEVGSVRPAAGHVAVFCACTSAWRELVERALRPRRTEQP